MTETAQSIGNLILTTCASQIGDCALEVILDGPVMLPPAGSARLGIPLITCGNRQGPAGVTPLPVFDDTFALVAARLRRGQVASAQPLIWDMLHKTRSGGFLCLSAPAELSKEQPATQHDCLESVLSEIGAKSGLQTRLVEAFTLRHADDGESYRYAIAARENGDVAVDHALLSAQVAATDVVIGSALAHPDPAARGTAMPPPPGLPDQLSRIEADREALLEELRKALLGKVQAEDRVRRTGEEFVQLAEIYLQKSLELDEANAKTEWLHAVAEALVTISKRNWMPGQDWKREIRKRLLQKGLFDGRAYLEAYPDIAAAGMDPLLHFVQHGLNEARQPSPPLPEPGRDYAARARALLKTGAFSSTGYEQDYPDVLASSLLPAEHFIRIGEALNRKPRARATGLALAPSGSDRQPRARPPFRAFGIIEHEPLISIIIVSYNSGRDLATLLPSIAAQTYQNFEVVLVENGTEHTEPLLRQHVARWRYERADNIGFAAANNLALSLSDGELIALINPDTRLDPQMLQHLVDAMRLDEAAAVVVPKINFFEKFVRLAIRCDAPFSLATDELLAGLSYRKHFVRSGSSATGRLHSDPDGLLELDLPFESERKIRCELRASANPITSCVIKVGNGSPQSTRWDRAIEVPVVIEFGSSSRAASRYLVNNAGSGLRADGTPFDRGFGEEDTGAFFGKTYVDAMCGCAALIRRTVLIHQKLFLDSFFAYFEDSEFSYRLARAGYKILYNPAAMIYHRHSESTEENSLNWRVLVSRSQKIYDVATGKTALPLSRLEFDYPDEFTGPLRRKLEQFDHELRAAGNMESLSRPRRRTACVYNTYFRTMGGGEKHALDIAEMLSQEYDVYIASEEDFSIEELSEYFDADLSKIRKIVCSNIDAHFTSNFSIFVNCTYRSNLSSYAALNFYVVSFPHRDAELSILERYTFLHNSEYTKRWAEKYWGDHHNVVLLPILGQPTTPINVSPTSKKQQILSVGRFTPDGHCKNQHVIVEAFRQFVARDPNRRDWQLRLMGSCNMLDARACDYLAELERSASGLNVSIEVNAPRERLAEAYASAAIYVHATGVGCQPGQPELHEHFGIAPFEAMAHGCLPAVYAEGGPAKQVQGLAGAITYGSPAELVPALLAAVEAIEQGTFDPALAVQHATTMIADNRSCARTLILESAKDKFEKEIC